MTILAPIDIQATAQRVSRVTSIYFQLDRVFEDDDAMFDWLTQPSAVFNHAYPIDMLRTEDGIETVSIALTRQEYGVYV